MEIFEILIIGAGSWGTTIAKVLAEKYPEKNIYLYSNISAIADEINSKHTNKSYLNGVTLSENIIGVSELERSVAKSEVIIIAVPSRAVSSVCEKISVLLEDNRDFKIACLSKGFVLEKDNIFTMTDVIEQHLPLYKNKIAVIYGPSHAEEVSARYQTCLCVASKSENLQLFFSDLLLTTYIQCVTSYDVKGVEFVGTLKNPLAIAAGMLVSLDGCGDNILGAFIVEAMKELNEIGRKFGFAKDTIYGVSGLGDLITTSVSKHSRNRRYGIEIVSQGKFSRKALNIKESIYSLLNPDFTIYRELKKSGYLVEGGYSLKPIILLCQKHNLDPPLFRAVYDILANKKDPYILVDIIKNPQKSEEILRESKVQHREKPEGLEKVKGQKYYEVISKRTFKKLQNNEELLRRIKNWAPKVIISLEERTRKKSSEKSLKEKHRLGTQIKLWKEVSRSNSDFALKKSVEKLCDVYAGEIADNFSFRINEFIRTFIIAFFKFRYRFKREFVFKNARDIIVVEGEKLDEIKSLAKTHTVLYMPMHKSNTDSIWVSWALAFNDLSAPRFAAGINLITSYFSNFLLKSLGAYTVDREEKRNFLYLEVLKQYSSFLLENGINSLIFAEGTRSRNGAIGSLQTGLLETALKVPTLKRYQVVIVPMALSFESVPEDEFFSKKGSRFWVSDYVTRIKKVYINFCDPIEIDSSLDSEDSIKSITENVVHSWKQNVKLLPNQIFCRVMKDNSYSIEKSKLNELTQITLDKIEGNILTGDVERIVKEGVKFLLAKKAIIEDEHSVKALEEGIINYYANMIP